MPKKGDKFEDYAHVEKRRQVFGVSRVIGMNLQNRDPMYSSAETETDATVVLQSPHQSIWGADDEVIGLAPSMASSFEQQHHRHTMLKAAQYVRRVNSRLSGFEGGFISKEGIQDREWYKHLGVAPGKWLGYGATTFPALTEALDENNVTRAKHEVDRLVVLLEDLADFLKL
jgi:hypothetical protein